MIRDVIHDKSKLEEILTFKDKNIKDMSCREYHMLYSYKEKLAYSQYGHNKILNEIHIMEMTYIRHFWNSDYLKK